MQVEEKRAVARAKLRPFGKHGPASGSLYTRLPLKANVAIFLRQPQRHATKMTDLNGRARLSSPGSTLTLQATSRAYIASSGENANHHGRLTAAALTASSSSRPWISRGRNYHLAMSISFEEDIAADQEKSLVEQMAQALFETKFWHQFGMKASSKQCTDHLRSGCHEFAVQLEHDDIATTTQRQHKLQEGVPFRDVRPPKGVEIAHLNRVCFDLHYSHHSPNTLPRSEGALSMLSLQTGWTQSGQVNIEHDLLDLEEDQYDHINAWSHTTSCSAMAQHECPFRIQDCDSEEALKWTLGEDLNSSQHLKRTLSQHAMPSTDAHAMINEHFELLLTAIVSTMDRPARHSRTTAKILSHESPQYLSECFPSLWTPGYLENVSTRAALLPTISHSLGQVCGARAKSQTLRSKLAELCRRAGSCSEDADANNIEHEAQSDFQPPLSLRLWHILDTNAYRMASASRLKPISTSDLTPCHSHSADEDLLESQVRDILPPREPEDQFDDNLSALDDEILDHHGTTAEEWSTGTSTQESLTCAWGRGSAAGIQDHQEQDRWPRDAHEELDLVEDDLSSICESIGSLALTNSMVDLDVAEQHQILSRDLGGPGRIVGYDSCVEPLVVDMDDEMLL
ncbi:hypothetical protein AC579_2917 [Pseudocercospora musae]|uniref:Uncharacterized protein n=1 Tax=Pseudocercospora musae TaxID=113226 RepID=A0A139IUI1_9PEZI|nr:hypothetical protein AC579_2917 [Pseudocercospora musae]